MTGMGNVICDGEDCMVIWEGWEAVICDREDGMAIYMVVLVVQVTWGYNIVAEVGGGWYFEFSQFFTQDGLTDIWEKKRSIKSDPLIPRKAEWQRVR